MPCIAVINVECRCHVLSWAFVDKTHHVSGPALTLTRGVECSDYGLLAWQRRAKS